MHRLSLVPRCVLERALAATMHSANPISSECVFAPCEWSIGMGVSESIGIQAYKNDSTWGLDTRHPMSYEGLHALR